MTRPCRPLRASGRPKAAPLEPWERLDFDPRAWSAVLRRAGVDDTARMELFLLAQLGEEGKREANTVISKVLKHQADGTEVRNASAFVHSCVRNARHRSTGGHVCTLICSRCIGRWAHIRSMIELVRSV